MAFQSDLLKSLSSTSESVQPFMLSNTETEPVIEIDLDSRKIKVPKELQNIGVAGDHLCETVYFTCGRYFDDDDLSNRKCIIRYINAGNEYGEYEVTDLEALDETTIKFGWTLSKYVTRYKGTVKFTVQFETEDTYQFQTTPAIFTILAGLDIEDTITDKDDILFRTLTNQLEILQNNVDSLLAQSKSDTETIKDLKERVETLEEEVAYLKDNVIYALEL